VPFVEAGSTRLYYREFGAGIPATGQHMALPHQDLVFLHGGWGYEVYPFDCAIAALSARFRILIPDRSGYGRSPKLRSLPPDFHARAAEETLRFLDALHIDRALLWGHSDGAVIAALLGLNAPQRFRGLILEAFHYARAKRGSLDFFRATISDAESVSGRAMEALARDHGDAWRQVLDQNATAWLKLVQSGGGDFYDGRLSQLAVPALFIDGSRDPRIEPGDPEAIRHALPQAEFRVIEGAGHSPHSEPNAAEECVRIAAEWCNKLCLAANGRE
jgi:pimeloyl-ACP methyl ester carboxylesterase